MNNTENKTGEVTVAEQLKFAESVGVDPKHFDVYELKERCIKVMTGKGTDTSSQRAWNRQREVARSLLGVLDGSSKRVSING